MSSSISKSSQSSFFLGGWLIGGLSLMDRYILGQLLMPFLFGVGAFSSIAVSIGALFDLVRKVTVDDLSLAIALQVFLLRLPEFVVYALPMATLLAALITYSRLSSDSELIALRGCGISVARLVVPAVLLSLLVTGMTFSLSELVAPHSSYQASTLVNKALKKNKPTYQEQNILYRQFANQVQPNGRTAQVLAQLFYAKGFNGAQMLNLTVLNFEQQNLRQIITAESATWNPAQNAWDFVNGAIYFVGPDGSYQSIQSFPQQQFAIARTPLDLASRDRDTNEMNIAEAQEYVELLQQSADEQTLRKWQVRIQQKYAFPFVCVVFGLIGAVLGSKPQRTTKATGFGISVLVIFVYYLLWFLCGALGQGGVLSPLMSAWLPNLAGFGIGGFLLSQTK